MRLTRIYKTMDSQSGNCPAGYTTDTGTYVVQGRCTAIPTAVEVPADVAAWVREVGGHVERTESGRLLVHGRELDPQTAAQLLERAADETAVELTGLRAG